MKILKIVLLSLVCLGIGIGAGFYLAGKKILPGPNNSQKAAKKEKSGKKILFYRNPMNPSVTSPVPKKDDMGMDYVPVYEGGGAENGPAGTV
ncbi:MAG: efflux transporter periplasmic adaptor subunit, partial [Thermodesulfatator sp.]